MPTADDFGENELMKEVQPTASSPIPFAFNIQLMFERMLVEFQVDNDLPSSFIERKSTTDLITGYSGGAKLTIPSKAELDGRILENYVEFKRSQESEQTQRDYQQHPLLAGAADRLNRSNAVIAELMEQIADKHLIHWDLALHDRTLLTYPLPHVGYRGARGMLVSAAQIDDWLHRLSEKEQSVDAVVMKENIENETTERSRHLLALCWPRTAFISCFANDINVLIKSLIKSTAFYEVVTRAEAVVVAFNSRPSLKKELHKQMHDVYGKALPLFQLNESQWASMQASLASILRVRTVLQVLAVMHRGDERGYPDEVRALVEDKAWDELASAEQVVASLAKAAYLLHRQHPATVADVVAVLREIYRAFARHASLFGTTLVESAEKLWRRYEQPLFVLGFFLHPHHVNEARNILEARTSVTGVDRICDFAVYYYRRFVGEDYGDVGKDMKRWVLGEFSTGAAAEADGSALGFWRAFKAEHAQSVLPELAMRILSIKVNTTTCEAQFRMWGGATLFIQRVKRLNPVKAKNLFLVREQTREKELAFEMLQSKNRRLIAPEEHKKKWQSGASSDPIDSK